MSGPVSVPFPPRMTRLRWFLTLIARSATGRGLRASTALAAVVLAATVTTALASLQVSLQSNLSRELAVFGPNILIASPGRPLPLAPLAAAALRAGVSIAPFRLVHAVVRGAGTAAIQAIDPPAQRRMSGWWRVRGSWMERPGEAMVGQDLARSLGISPGGAVVLGPPVSARYRVTGIISSGSEDDGSVFVPLAGGMVDGAQGRAQGDAARVEAAATQLSRRAPPFTVHVLQRVARADTLVLSRLGAVFGLLGLIIVIGAGLCVATTFSTMVYQRSREIGLQKALGATDFEVVALFWGEALLFGAAGASIGYLLGLGFAEWMGQSVFHTSIKPEPVVILAVLVIAVGMTLLAAIPSARSVARIEPAATLKGSRSDDIK